MKLTKPQQRTLDQIKLKKVRCGVLGSSRLGKLVLRLEELSLITVDKCFDKGEFTKNGRWVSGEVVMGNIRVKGN